MFGYVRPCRPELKCREMDLYKSTYCGLCCTLRQRYGMLAPMFLSFDMTFLALLLEPAETAPSLCKGRCHANLLFTKTVVTSSAALDIAADYTVLLAWHQLQDRIADDTFFKKQGSRVLAAWLKSSYKKAAALHPQFEERLVHHLQQLNRLELEQCPSMDQVADCFALILQETVPASVEQDDNNRYRSLRLLLYHVGRWIYLIDARDDYQEDARTENYNPLRYRYGETIDEEGLADTLSHSLSLAYSSLTFLDLGIRSGIIDNILSLGLPLVQHAVQKDIWKQEKKNRMWRKSG